MDVRLFVVLFYLVPTVTSDDALFDSGKRFVLVDPTPGDAEHEDPKHTGSGLFDSNVDNNDKKRLSLLVTVQRFRSQKSNLFRAHNVFVRCLQQVMNTLQNEDTPLMIYSGYKTKSETGGSNLLQDLYARAGTGAQLKFRPQVPSNKADIKKIAKAALKFCPAIFEEIQRDIGIIMMSDRVHIHMTGEDDEEPYFSSDGWGEMDTAAFTTWALDRIDEGIDPVHDPDCSKFTGLDAGGVHPTGVTSPEEAVGVVDEPITRQNLSDFKKLVQFQGRNIVFVNQERTASWCGTPGNPCVDCTNKPAGNSVLKRCASRLMSARMHNFLRVLQHMTRTKMSGIKLMLVKAFDEEYEGHTDADYLKNSLHVEGRQVKLQLDHINTETNLKTVTKFAQCIGVDYIKHNGDHIILAVKKMKGRTEQKINFQGNELLACEPPEAKRGDYKLPDLFDESENDDYPLFDSNSQLEQLVADDTPLKLFVSKDNEFRYFRLRPPIARCYSLLLHQHNKFNEPDDPTTGIDVVRGFVSRREESVTIDSFDQRYNTFTLGLAMEITYSDNPKNLTLHNLLKTAIDKCGPLFDEYHQNIGLGLYEDRVFVDMRDDFGVWTDDEKLIPEEYGDIHQYAASMETRYEAAIDFRIVDPDDLAEAKKSADVPHMQSPAYRHQTPPHVLRRRRSAPHTDDCVPQRDTKFCKDTEKHRKEHVADIWKEISRKWHYHDEQEVLEALENCFLRECGTCSDGEIYDSKLEHCDNLLHWVPFGLMNEKTISSIFPRDNNFLRKYASMGHSIEDSEVFHLVVNTVEALYRPDPTKSVEEELYPHAENPSPVMKVLLRLYAIHASGLVKVWVKDDTDISSLREPLQDLMLYNKNVTNVEVYVSSPGSKEAVDAALQSLKMEWATTGYPLVTREIIAPFSIHDLPNLETKRDRDTAIRDQLIENHWNWESKWINQEL